jgi:hypothetical protein
MIFPQWTNKNNTCMKIIFLFLTLVGLLAREPVSAQSAASRSQPAPQNQPLTPEDRAEAITASMVKNLRLSPAQTERVKQINLNSIQMVEALRQQYRTEPSRLNQEVQTIGSSRLAQLKDVLTPAQFAAYQQRRETKMGIPRQAGSQNP